MVPIDAPDEIRRLADARAAARRARDWATADALKAEIESAGWKVIDTGTLYDLEPAAPPDLAADGATWYGSSRSVPSRLDEAPVGLATVVTVIEADPAEAAPLARSLAAHAPDGTRLVVVADGLGPAHAAGLAALDAADPGAPGVVTEVVRTSTRLGAAAARNAGIRRAGSPIVVLADPRLEADGDFVSALVSALEDPSVAVAGPWGLVSDDLRHFDGAPDGAGDVVAIDLAALAFRRTDAVARGLLDEHFADPALLDAWWSLVLRDPADEADEDEPARRAVQVPGLPVARPASDGGAAAGEDRERAVRRNRYRLLKRFATRRDLLVAPVREP